MRAVVVSPQPATTPTAHSSDVMKGNKTPLDRGTAAIPLLCRGLLVSFSLLLQHLIYSPYSLNTCFSSLHLFNHFVVLLFFFSHANSFLFCLIEHASEATPALTATERNDMQVRLDAGKFTVIKTPLNRDAASIPLCMSLVRKGQSTVSPLRVVCSMHT